MQLGCEGDYVKDFQNKLNAVQNCGLDVDGIFGNKTAQCVMSFQKDNGLESDGVAGSKTIDKLNSKYTELQTKNDEANLEYHKLIFNTNGGTFANGETTRTVWYLKDAYQLSEEEAKRLGSSDAYSLPFTLRLKGRKNGTTYDLDSVYYLNSTDRLLQSLLDPMTLLLSEEKIKDTSLGYWKLLFSSDDASAEESFESYSSFNFAASSLSFCALSISFLILSLRL